MSDSNGGRVWCWFKKRLVATGSMATRVGLPRCYNGGPIDGGNDMENWRPIPGYEGFYEASDEGSIRSVSRTVHLRDGRTRCFAGQLLKPRIDRDGYELVHLQKEGSKKTFRVHRLILQAFVGPCPPAKEGAHADGNQQNNRLDNLSWKTPKSNHADKRRHGTNNDGIKNGGARLNENQVRDIRQRHRRHSRKSGCAALAREFGVTVGSIRRIVMHKSWRNVACPC